MKRKVTFVDPPSGWKYGFPCIIPEDSRGSGKFEAFLRSKGYPEADIPLAVGYSRYWEEEIEENGKDCQACCGGSCKE